MNRKLSDMYIERFFSQRQIDLSILGATGDKGVKSLKRVILGLPSQFAHPPSLNTGSSMQNEGFSTFGVQNRNYGTHKPLFTDYGGHNYGKGPQMC